MTVNYVLMYGTPYVRYKEFETFEDISKFLVHKGYVNYSIFKKLEDKEEVEMIYRDNDIHYLENFVKEQDKKLQQKENIIKEVRESAKRELKIAEENIKNSEQYLNVEEEQEHAKRDIHTGKIVKRYMKMFLEILDKVEE